MRQVTILGDSILRDISEGFSSDFDVNVHCLPGTTYQRLRTYINSNTDSFCKDTTIVLVHVGTNNLEGGVWEKDRWQFLNLIFTLKEKFRCADIFISLILPRWDCDLLYEQSKYYNTKIIELSKIHNFKIFDSVKDFNRTDAYYTLDGLHLNIVGKAFLAQNVEIYLNNVYTPKLSERSPWIPPELKILHTPKKKKQQPLPWTETNLDLVAYKKREKYGTHRYTCKSRRRRRIPQKRNRKDTTPDGFLHPVNPYRPPPPPQLPPNRYVPRKLPATIPYINFSTSIRHAPITPSTPIPAPPSPYLQRKKCGQRKRRRQQREKAKRRKKNKKASVHSLELMEKKNTSCKIP